MNHRPIRRRVVIKKSLWNIPEEGYVTPRLKPPEVRTEAVGFIHDFDVNWTCDEA